ncbi:SurA N-terminal domain-containing protein [Phenylobacterium sp.]|uniref:peptidylprolyl isomerase n=1 Tax=Phenylobacterium sp. TaxID=1871053 RepID=UPI003566E06F
MLAAIRAFAKSPYAAVLIGLLIISFAVFGARDMFRAKVSTDVVTAGNRSISPADFKREFDGYKSQVEQQVGQPITPEIAAANGLDRRVLEGVATREAFAALLTKIGLRPSDKLIAGEIQKIPAFFDQVTGRFDKQSYLRRLADNGMTSTTFDARVRDQITEQQAATGLVAGLRAPRAYTALAAVYGLESRDFGYFGIEPSSVPPPAPPTDAQLTQFMKENASQLTRPEFRVLTVVRFSPALIAGSLPIDEAELKKRFDFRKDTLSSPETRTIIQIPVKNPAAAQQIIQGLAKGQDAAAVAKAAGVEAITYDNKPQTAIPDPKVGAAAFQTPAGQAAMVKGDLGMAVVKVVSVTKGHAVTLEEVRPAIEAELRKDAATDKVYALTQAYDDAHQGGASLAAAAQKAGVPTVTLGPLTQNGRDLTGQPVQGLTQKLVETAWSLPAGGESEVEDAGGGEYFAVRVEKVIPPAMPPLDEVKPKLVQVWMQRELAKAMETRAQGFADRVKKGESLDAVAKAAGATVTQVPGIDRRTAGQNPMLSQDMLSKLFTSRPGDTFTAQNNHFGFVVGKLEAIHAGDPATIARMAEDLRPQMSQAFFREIGESAHTAARNTIKVTVDANRARQAIGLEPIDPKAASGSKGAAKPALAK